MLLKTDERLPAKCLCVCRLVLAAAFPPRVLHHVDRQLFVIWIKILGCYRVALTEPTVLRQIFIVTDPSIEAVIYGILDEQTIGASFNANRSIKPCVLPCHCCVKVVIVLVFFDSAHLVVVAVKSEFVPALRRIGNPRSSVNLENRLQVAQITV